MFRATWKGLLGHKLRMALTLLAIVLGVGLVAGSYIFTDTLTRVFDDLFADSFAGIDVQVRRSFDADLGFALPDRMPESLAEEIGSIEGVEQAVGTVAGLITLAGPEDVVGGQGPPTIAGSWAETASPLSIREGVAPISDAQIAIDAATVEREGLEIGDQVTVLALGAPEPFRIVGTLGFGGSDNFGGATFVAFEYRTAQRLLGAEGEIDAISIVGDPSLTPEQLIARINPMLPEGVEAVTAQTAAEEQLANFKQALGFLNTFLLVFGFVSLFVGAFLIQNTFQIIVAQRTRELALLRAIGATRKQVSGMVLGEALLVGLIGSLIGVGAGAGLAMLIRAAFQAFGGDLPSTGLQILPRTVAVAVAAGVGVTLVSAYLPARRAGKVPPVAAMRQAFSLPSSRSLHRRTIVGSTVLATGAAILAIGLLVTIESEAIPEVALVGVGAGILFIGLSILAPTFARPMGRFLGAPLPAMFGTTGKMARENAVRSPRRTAATASALMIGVALVGLVTIIAATIEATTEELIADRFRSDLVVQSAGFGGAGLSPALAESLSSLPEVATTVRVRTGPVKVGDDVRFVGASDLSTYETAVRLEAVAGTIGEVGAGEIALGREEAEELGLGLGDQLAVTFTRTGQQELTVAAIFDQEGPGADFLLDLTTWDENFIERSDQSIFVIFADGVETSAAREAVESVVDLFPGSAVLDQSEFQEQAASQLDSFVLLIYALLTLALVIGFVGIVNTLLLSVYERTREIGLLRAVGTTRRQLRRMVTWEAVIIAVFGALVGLGVGVLFGWAVVLALGEDSQLVFTIPTVRLALAVVAAGIAGVIAALYPARRAAKLDILRAIAYE